MQQNRELIRLRFGPLTVISHRPPRFISIYLGYWATAETIPSPGRASHL